MTWGLVAVAGATLVSTYVAGESAKDAAQAQMDAASSAEEVQKAMYESNKATLEPFMAGALGAGTKPREPVRNDFGTGKAGEDAFYDAQVNHKVDLKDWEDAGGDANVGSLKLQQAYSGALGVDAQREAYANYQESPGVAWQRDQGMRSVTNDAAITGRGGGARLKAISEFNQGLAMQDFSNSFNRLGSISGTGLTAANSIAGVGTQSAAGQAQAITQYGQAQAGGIMGRSNAMQQGVSQLANIGGQYLNSGAGGGSTTNVGGNYQQAPGGGADSRMYTTKPF